MEEQVNDSKEPEDNANQNCMTELQNADDGNKVDNMDNVSESGIGGKSIVDDVEMNTDENINKEDLLQNADDGNKVNNMDNVSESGIGGKSIVDDVEMNTDENINKEDLHKNKSNDDKMEIDDKSDENGDDSSEAKTEDKEKDDKEMECGTKSSQTISCQTDSEKGSNQTGNTSDHGDDTSEDTGIMIDESEIIKDSDESVRVLRKSPRKTSKVCNTEDDSDDDDDESDEDDDNDDEESAQDQFSPEKSVFTEEKEKLFLLKSAKPVLTEEEEKLFLLPFKSGWKREVVFRKTFPKTGSQTPADVYYRPPTGRKLRSMVDIAKHLVMTDSDMTTDNFTFARKPLFKPPFEVVRNAGVTGRGFASSPRRGHTSLGSKKSPKVGRPRKSKYISTKPEIVIERDEDGPNSTTPFKLFPAKKRVGRPKIITTVLVHPKKRLRPFSGSPDKKVEIIKQEGDDDDSMIQLLAASESEKKMVDTPPFKKYKPTARKSTTQKSFKSTLSPNQSATGLLPLCNWNCPGQENIPPELQCVVCLCLFHPYCVNADVTLRTFVCLRCINVKVNSALKTVKVVHTNTPKTSTTKTLIIPSYKQTHSATNNLNPETVKVKTEPEDYGEYSDNTTTSKTNTDISHKTLGSLKSVLDKRTTVTIPSNTNTPVLVSALNSSNSTSLLTPTVLSGLGIPNQAAQAYIMRPSPVTSVHSTFPIVPNIPNFRALSVPTSQAVKITSPVLEAPSLTITEVTSLAPASTKGHTLPMPNMKSILTNSQSKSETPGLAFANGVDVQQAAKNGQLLTLPNAVAKRLNLQQPMALKINNKQITVPPSCFLHTNDGLKVFLPPKTFPVQSGETAKLSVTLTSDKSLTSDGSNVSVRLGDEEDGNSTDKSDSPDKGKIRTSKSRCPKDKINPGNCHIKKIYGGFDCILCIFKYLNVPDLMRASLVCRTWNQVAMHPCLWREVRFKNLKVQDWKKTVQFLLARAVKCLNFKGLQTNDKNSMWNNLVSVLPMLASVNAIHLGLVPASILHSICERMLHLEILTAQWISNYSYDEIWTRTTPLDIGKFASLKDLRELQLRGVAGISLPTFTLEDQMSDLVSLKNLEKLSLTTMKGVPEHKLLFLSNMHQLHTLEIGDCVGWSTEIYSCIGKLHQLRCLRLESGGDACSDGVVEMLHNLKKLETLELIMFVIAEKLKNPIQELDNLKTLVVWPNTVTSTENPAKVNNNTLKVVSGLTKLKRLEWGIVSDKESSIIIDNDEDSSPKGQQDKAVEWIPFSSLESCADTDTNSVPLSEYINVYQFTEKLSKLLPDAKIKVYSSKMIDSTICVQEESR